MMMAQVEAAIHASCESYGADVAEDAIAAARGVAQDDDRDAWAREVAAAVARVLERHLRARIAVAERELREARHRESLAQILAVAMRQPVGRWH